MKILIDSISLKEIASVSKHLIFEFWDKYGHLEVMIDCNENAFVTLPPKGRYIPDDTQNVLYQLTGRTEIALDEYWIEEYKAICGGWSISSPDSDWSLLMDSDDFDYFEEGSGDLTSDSKELILSKITDKSLFLMVMELIDKT